MSESDRARLDEFRKLRSASYRLVVSFSIRRDGPGDYQLELVAANSEDSRLIMQFGGIRQLTLDWPELNEVPLDLVEIIDVTDRGWEDIQYRVFEGAGFFSFWCRDFTATLQGRTDA